MERQLNLLTYLTLQGVSRQTKSLYFGPYERQPDGELLDLDLKEVVIRRAPGAVALTLENFIASDPLVTVSAGTARKSIPIDIFGEFTYLVRTRDTSGNFSENVTGVTLTTTRPARSTVVAAYNEDSPSVAFAGITNTNAGEVNYPSFADSNTEVYHSMPPLLGELQHRLTLVGPIMLTELPRDLRQYLDHLLI